MNFKKEHGYNSASCPMDGPCGPLRCPIEALEFLTPGGEGGGGGCGKGKLFEGWVGRGGGLVGLYVLL